MYSILRYKKAARPREANGSSNRGLISNPSADLRNQPLADFEADDEDGGRGDQHPKSRGVRHEISDCVHVVLAPTASDDTASGLVDPGAVLARPKEIHPRLRRRSLLR